MAEMFAMAIAVALELAKAAALAATTVESCPTSRAAATAVEAACSSGRRVVELSQRPALVLQLPRSSESRSGGIPRSGWLCTETRWPRSRLEQ